MTNEKLWKRIEALEERCRVLESGPVKERIVYEYHHHYHYDQPRYWPQSWRPLTYSTK